MCSDRKGIVTSSTSVVLVLEEGREGGGGGEGGREGEREGKKEEEVKN